VLTGAQGRCAPIHDRRRQRIEWRVCGPYTRVAAIRHRRDCVRVPGQPTADHIRVQREDTVKSNKRGKSECLLGIPPFTLPTMPPRAELTSNPARQLVGISVNCWPTPHVQAMVWATDSEGLGLSVHPPPTSPRHDEWMEILFSHAEDFPRPADHETSDPDWVEKGLSQCFANRFRAVEAEIAATGIVLGCQVPDLARPQRCKVLRAIGTVGPSGGRGI
jgi:hypothetical protein